MSRWVSTRETLRCILPNQRHAQHGPLIAEPHCFDPGVFGIGCSICDVDCSPFEGRAACQGGTARGDRVPQLKLLVLGGYPNEATIRSCFRLEV